MCQNRDMTQPSPDDRPAVTGTERGVGDVLLALLSGSALAPFVQAIATKAGEDVHNKIKGLLGKHKPAEPKPGEPITLVDQRKAIVLELPETLRPADAYDLANVRVPAVSPRQYLLVRYDPASGCWRAESLATPPAGAIDVDGTA